MASGDLGAGISGIFALGNQVTTNSSACSTGTEAVGDGNLDRIRATVSPSACCAAASKAASHYIWAGFDAMRVLCRDFNDEPEKASRPMSASRGGLHPRGGCGRADAREPRERPGAWGPASAPKCSRASAVNCGGHRGGGSMTAPESGERPTRCIRGALADAAVEGHRTRSDAISGHLTATGADPEGGPPLGRPGPRPRSRPRSFRRLRPPSP